jgi:nucleoside 2-deoxyribosyltransferase
MAEPSQKQCFIISPIGADDSDIRRVADFFREDIVRKALGDEFEIRRADDYNGAGNITSQVIQAIAKADLIVADLTGRNPNVYYELGFAHTHERHVVPMISIENEHPLPFDNYTERTIKYSLRNVQDRDGSVARLKQAVQETLSDSVSNPVTTALGLAKAVAEGDDKAQLLVTLTGVVARLDSRVEQQDRQIQALNRALARPSTAQDDTQSLGDILGAALARAKPAIDPLTGQPQGLINQPPLAGMFDPNQPRMGLLNSPLDPPTPGFRVPPDSRPARSGKK